MFECAMRHDRDNDDCHTDEPSVFRLGMVGITAGLFVVFLIVVGVVLINSFTPS